MIKINIKNFGIILDIDPSKFIADGAFYLNSDITEENENTLSNISLLSAKISKYNFDAKINKLIDEVNNNEKNKTVKERSKEIIDFFEEKKDKLLDLIILSDTGIRGTNKVILEENSIFYLKISENLKLGFFINKTLATYLNIGDNNVS